MEAARRAAPAAMPDTELEAATYAKVAWRIIPLLFVCYVVSYLDRVNVGFAKLQMLNDLSFSESVYGLGAGIFFLGYFLFEVPSNLILYRVGARKWIARIMITWGVVSAAMLFVKTPTMFYVMRLFLGVAEAGFFPGMILYLTYWFPAERRGGMTALFMTGIPIAGVVGGPLSGWILQSMSGVSGLAGWQWLFVLEGLPSIVMGVLVLALLKDRIADASWLTSEQKLLLQEKVANDSAEKNQHISAFHAFRNAQVWLLAAIYFCLIMGLYGVSFWMPSIIKSMGIKEPVTVGLIYAIPYAAGTISMILVGRSADATKERRWHIAIPSLFGAVGLVASVVFGGSPVLAIASLTLATMGILSAIPLFWSCPTAFLDGAAAAGGIALINSLGNLAGFVSPYMVGFVKDMTHSTDVGMYMLAAFMCTAAILIIAGLPARLVNK
ncbi:MFS transporter [Paraburkholderia sp. Tr-20389]|uniref:MFS transporter n=1 Tax=Paraburkholderia sp. Tr-20389 TaxID=2703903 RepID=UPI00197EB3D4|nr:MFS transporter [Paraburkholderia sp. Tr-20389]MBN3754353.1 MFS transporter [Paraburkholderia sp. Tr-20389]